MELKDIIKDAHVVSEDATFEDALRKMIKEQTNSLLVIDDTGILVGEVSISDLFDGMIPLQFDGDDVAGQLRTDEDFAEAIENARYTPVSDFMSVDYETVQPDDGFAAIAASAIGRQRARIPVTDHEGRPIGIVSRQGLKKILGKYLGIKG